jgi:hemerythrin superfamily protein
MTTAHQQDIVDDVITDHREVEEVFAEIEKGGGGKRRDLVEHVIAELVRHSVAEEQYLYPVARRVLPDGDKIADHELEEHAEAERVMKSLEETDADDPKFATRMNCASLAKSSRTARRWHRRARIPRHPIAHQPTRFWAQASD